MENSSTQVEIKSTHVSPKKLKSSKQAAYSSGRSEGYRHYSKAPLTEAVLDIRVELPSEITLQELAKVQEGEENDTQKRRMLACCWANVNGVTSWCFC